VRTIWFDKGSFILNGGKTLIKGILLQPNYPVGLIDSVDPQMEVDELNLVKKAGFNLIRLHVRPGSERYLRLCDELGLLVYQESAIAWMAYDPQSFELYQNEIRDMALHSYNHPSVVRGASSCNTASRGLWLKRAVSCCARRISTGSSGATARSR
jgi:beta-galactosidase/beta-glucuronidase